MISDSVGRHERAENMANAQEQEVGEAKWARQSRCSQLAEWTARSIFLYGHPACAYTPGRMRAESSMRNPRRVSQL